MRNKRRNKVYEGAAVERKQMKGEIQVVSSVRYMIGRRNEAKVVGSKQAMDRKGKRNTGKSKEKPGKGVGQ